MKLRKPPGFNWMSGKIWAVKDLAAGVQYWCPDCGFKTLGWPPHHLRQCPRATPPTPSESDEP